MPHVSIFGWNLRGTPKYANIIMNTNMLSIDSEYSITYPVKNCIIRVLSSIYPLSRPKISVMATHVRHSFTASLRLISCTCFADSFMSRQNIADATIIKTSHMICKFVIRKLYKIV